MQQLRSSLEKLFVYYCDYSLDKGQIYIKQASFTKLLRDAQILEERSGGASSSASKPWRTLTEKEVNLMMSKELNNPQIKSLDFQSFLNMLVKISLLLQSKRTSVSKIRGAVAISIDGNPKEALESLLAMNVLPLLENIEQSIKQQKQSSNHISSITLNG